MHSMDRFISLITIFISIFIFSELSYAENLADQVRRQIQERINTAQESSQGACRDSVVCKSTLLPKLYTEREYLPAWSDDYGPFPYVEDFVEVIRNAYREGLRPEDYQLHKIEAALSGLYTSLIGGETLDSAKVAELDLMITDAFLLYASHLVNGRVDHRRVYPDWVVNQRSADLTAVLQRALASGEIEEELADLSPHYPGYVNLKEKLMEYRGIAEKGGWQRIPQGPKLQKGSRGERVAILKQRLMVSGDLESVAEDKHGIFDHDLEAAVRRFQKRNGLKDDGRVGRSTLEALNVPVEKRIRQIALNMDRLRWLPDDHGDRNIFVNIADFSLDVIEDEKSVMAMRIIAGKNDWRSCVLSAKMTYLELNPFWKVPDSIATKEILPKIRKDPGYLAKKNIKVYWNWTDQAKEIDPMTVNWSRAKVNNFRYKFRQEPGPGNPLGRIKFIFPNDCEIYLHDTPTRHLFGRARRDFSHGCIRIEKPVELATYLLRNKETWTRKKILAEIRKGKRQVVMLPDPINVLIFYGTAWVDREGVLQFRNDIYRIDEIPYELPAGNARASAAAK